MITIKRPDEIEKMRAAGQLVAEILGTLEAYALPGVSTGELNIIAENECKKNGAIPVFKNYPHPFKGRPFPATICTSVNEEVVHGIPGTRVLKEGDIMSIDFGVILDGYAGDSAITIPIGKVNSEAIDLIQATEASLFKGIEQAWPGNRIGKIGHAIEGYAREQGYSVVRDYVGHGIGKDMHEDPSVPNYGRSNSGPILKPGMVIAIEPMLNMGTHYVLTRADYWTVFTRDGLPSAHFEHTVAISDNGPEILTVR